MPTILAVDDEASVRESYRVILSDRYRVLLAKSASEALGLLKDKHVDLILLDIIMPNMTGMEFLDRLEANGDATPVIMVTATNSVRTAVEAMKKGAREYIMKPFDVDELLLTVDRTLDVAKDKRELKARREADRSGFETIIGESVALTETLSLAGRAMKVDSTVLITGESGTGKDLLARAIHTGGKRVNEAFVPVSSCAIPTQLIESELFGHEKGAFTGAIEKRAGKMQIADKGTLFLDEIGEMPVEAQTKLLRVLQDGTFFPVGSTKLIDIDVRFIFATNRDLKLSIKDGTFREDLFFRINVLPIELPALRQRREDIPMLVDHFIAKYAPRVNAAAEQFSAEAIATMASHSWPGNVRELENIVERVLVYHSDHKIIEPNHLQGLVPIGQREPITYPVELEGLPLEEATQRLERHLINRALERSANVQSRAAELLGTTRRILKYKMDQLELASHALSDDRAKKEAV